MTSLTRKDLSVADRHSVAATFLIRGMSPLADTLLLLVGIGLVLGAVVYSTRSRRNR
jgi:uncharacterized membrane protein SirB2